MVAASGLSATDWPLIAVIIVLLACSAFLAMAETSLVRTSTVKARSLVAEGRRGARALLGLVEHPERFLNPVLLLVLGCQLISATLVGVLTERWFGPIGVLIGIVFEVVVIFVVFEAVPKNWAVKNPERSALLVRAARLCDRALSARGCRVGRPHRARQLHHRRARTQG